MPEAIHFGKTVYKATSTSSVVQCRSTSSNYWYYRVSTKIRWCFGYYGRQIINAKIVGNDSLVIGFISCFNL